MPKQNQLQTRLMPVQQQARSQSQTNDSTQVRYQRAELSPRQQLSESHTGHVGQLSQPIDQRTDELGARSSDSTEMTIARHDTPEDDVNLARGRSSCLPQVFMTSSAAMEGTCRRGISTMTKLDSEQCDQTSISIYSTSATVGSMNNFSAQESNEHKTVAAVNFPTCQTPGPVEARAGLPAMFAGPLTMRPGEPVHQRPTVVNSLVEANFPGKSSERPPQSLAIPHFRPPTFVFPLADIPPGFSKRFEEVVKIFKENTRVSDRLGANAHWIDYMLKRCGPSLDDAHPSILVFCRPQEFKPLRALLESKELRFQYCRKLSHERFSWRTMFDSQPRQSAVVDSHRPLFGLYFWQTRRPRQLLHLWAGHESSSALIYQPTVKFQSCLTMCGSALRLAADITQFSTLGYVIQLGSEFYGVTASHTFRTVPEVSDFNSHIELRNKEPAMSSRSGSGTALSAQGQSGFDMPETIFTGAGTLSTEAFHGDESFLLENGEYDSFDEECNSDDSDDFYDSVGNMKEQRYSVSQTLVGEDPAKVYFPQLAEHRKLGESDFDWALVKLEDPTHWRPNVLVDHLKAQVHLLPNEVREYPNAETEVIIVTHSDIPLRGFLHSTPTMLGGLNGNVSSLVWSVSLANQRVLIKGASGSMVIDARTHHIYGHVVGSNPLGEAYVSPLPDLLRQLQTRRPDLIITLPEPMTTLESLVLSHHRLGNTDIANTLVNLMTQKGFQCNNQEIDQYLNSQPKHTVFESAISGSSIPRRLVICVDGTWCNPDGTGLPGAPQNITNVYQLYASIQEGNVTDGHGKSFCQKKLYIRGIGSEVGISHIQRLADGAFGIGCLDHIRNVYRECCRMSRPGDEVWLYGFSRGAYVVRAVASLLHCIQSLVSADVSDDSFETDYKEALEVYRGMQRLSQRGDGQIHHMLATTTREAPIIRFVGAFDTVKAFDDNKLFDITLNDSIKNFRHALALNETREAMALEYDFPQLATDQSLPGQTFVQAWFVGAHIDMGGSSAKDGLSLYPLQWMLTESKKMGLKLGFSGFGGRAKMSNPIQLVGLDTQAAPWTYTTENGIVFEMQDIRNTHQDQRHSVHLNRATSVFWKRKMRVPFDGDGNVEGFCPQVAQGTTIHPSVYLLLDWQLVISLDMEAYPFYAHLQKWRYKTLGYQNQIPVQGFWNDAQEQELVELSAIRILVCGNSGVGKSSLINKVFGVEITKSSDRSRGVHDVKKEITWPDRPDLIIHDSEGFEAAGLAEFEAIEGFLKDKSNETMVDQRLHAIWLCIEVSNTRPVQRSIENLFLLAEKFAQDIPIVVIATKKDEFEAIKEIEFRKSCKSQGKQATLDQIDEYAANQLKDQLQRIEKDISGVPGGRFDLCIAVSKDDDASIQNLTKKTSECFSQDRIRLLYIRAQVASLDLKIGLAITESMRVYRNVLYSSTALAGVSLGTTTNRVSSAINLCHSIVNCFGISGVSAQTIVEIYKVHLVDDIGHSLLTAVAEATAAVGLFATVVTGGIVPMFLVPMVTNIPLVVPTTARLLLMLTCDLILILALAFREASSQCKTQPDLQCIQKAASAYRSYSANVHARVKQLIPHATGAIKCYRTGDIELGVREILKYGMSLTAEYIAPTTAFRTQSKSSRNSTDSFASSSDESLAKERATIKETLQGLRSHLNSNGADSSPQMTEATRMMKEMGLAN